MWLIIKVLIAIIAFLVIGNWWAKNKIWKFIPAYVRYFYENLTDAWGWDDNFDYDTPEEVKREPVDEADQTFEFWLWWFVLAIESIFVLCYVLAIILWLIFHVIIADSARKIHQVVSSARAPRQRDEKKL